MHSHFHTVVFGLSSEYEQDSEMKAGVAKSMNFCIYFTEFNIIICLMWQRRNILWLHFFSKSFLLSEGDVGCAWGPMLMLAPLCGWKLSSARFSIDLFLFAGNAKKGTGVYRVTARIQTTDTRPSTAFRGPFSPPSDSWRRTTGRVSTSWWVLPFKALVGQPNLWNWKHILYFNKWAVIINFSISVVGYWSPYCLLINPLFSDCYCSYHPFFCLLLNNQGKW